MEFVMMMGMLRSGFGWPQGRGCQSHTYQAQNLTSLHDPVSLLEQAIERLDTILKKPGLHWCQSWKRNEPAQVKPCSC